MGNIKEVIAIYSLYVKPVIVRQGEYYYVRLVAHGPEEQLRQLLQLGGRLRGNRKYWAATRIADLARVLSVVVQHRKDYVHTQLVRYCVASSASERSYLARELRAHLRQARMAGAGRGGVGPGDAQPTPPEGLLLPQVQTLEGVETQSLEPIPPTTPA